MKKEKVALKVTKDAKNGQFIDCDVRGGAEVSGINMKFIRTKISNIYKGNKKKTITAIIVFIVGLTAFISNFTTIVQYIFSKNTQSVSLYDVQYELADEKGKLIRRWNWQDRPIFDSKGDNISKMILSIKLRNPNNFGLFAHIKNEKEISEMKYVEDLTGGFLNEHYLIPANGNTGYIFGIDITPITKITTLTKSPTNNQEIEIYSNEGEYLETVDSNIGKVYGLHIPYEIDILNDKEKIIDTLKFHIRCRAIVGELKAILSDDIEGVSGTISKTLDFECLPTF
jgi:hypothetical protein